MCVCVCGLFIYINIELFLLHHASQRDRELYLSNMPVHNSLMLCSNSSSLPNTYQSRQLFIAVRRLLMLISPFHDYMGIQNPDKSNQAFDNPK